MFRVLQRIELLVEIGSRDQAARVDGVDGGIRPVRGARQVREVAREVRVGKLAALAEAIPVLPPLFARLADASTEHRILAEARFGERIEVEAVADPDHHLPAIGDPFQLEQDVARRREGDVRAVADFGRSLRGFGSLDDLGGRQRAA